MVWSRENAAIRLAVALLQNVHGLIEVSRVFENVGALERLVLAKEHAPHHPVEFLPPRHGLMRENIRI